MTHAEFATRCHAIELLVDSLGDAAYTLAATADWNEINGFLELTTGTLNDINLVVQRNAPATSTGTAAHHGKSVRENRPSQPVDVQHYSGDAA